MCAMIHSMVTEEPAASIGWGTPAEGLASEPLVLHFAGGIPGFPDARSFEVVVLGPDLDPFAKLKSLDSEQLEFVVAPPGLLFADYTVKIDDDSAAALGIESAEDVAVLVIVTLAKAPATPTANLLGPLVINRRTREALQLVQHGSGYGVAVPLDAGSAI